MPGAGAPPVMALLAPPVTALLVAVVASGAAAQDVRVDVEAGVALSSPLIVDGNGTRVRLGPAIVAGAAIEPAAWRVGPVRAALTARASTATVRLEDDGARWTGGRAWQLELLATGTGARPTRLSPHVGAGLAWLGGGDDVGAVRDLARRPRPVAEAGVTLRAAPTARTALGVTAQGFPVTPSGGDTGGVLRVLVTVRHAW